MNNDPIIAPMKLFDLAGRTALVTGARRGIGRAVAQGLAAQGARVAIHHAGGEDEQGDAEAVVLDIVRSAGKAEAFSVDFVTPGSGKQLAATVLERFGHVDILVLNASIELLEDYETISTERFDRQIGINLRAPLELLQVLLPPMQQRGWGRVVTIGSIQQQRPHPHMLVYAGTKSAQLNWVRNLARQVGRNGVTVNNLAPGAIWTARNDPRFSDRAHREQLEQRVPVGRVGTPADLVGAALLLCSDAGSYINGADLHVDGGLSLG